MKHKMMTVDQEALISRICATLEVRFHGDLLKVTYKEAQKFIDEYIDAYLMAVMCGW
jgi:hypothetical protein